VPQNINEEFKRRKMSNSLPFFGKKVTQLYPQYGTPNYSKHPDRDKEA